MTLNLKRQVASSELYKVDDDHVYYNILIPHNPTSSTGGLPPNLATFEENRVQPILDKPSDYYLAVTRFLVPGGTIPIFIFRVNPYPNTDINQGIYSVTLSWNGNDVQQYVEYQTNASNNTSYNVPFAQIPPALSSSNPNQTLSNYYYVFSYQEMLDMVNTAISNALYTLINTYGAPSDAVAPYFIYNPQTQLFSLISQIKYFDEATANGGLGNLPTISLYVNLPLFRLFDGIEVISEGYNVTNNKYIRYVIKNNNNNFYFGNSNAAPTTYPYLYYQMSQEYPTIVNWNSLQSIVFTSVSLPSRSEYIPGTTSAGSVGLSQSGNNNFRQIITDFQVLQDLGGSARTVIQYFPQSPYRYVDLLSNDPLRKLDITVWWSDTDNNLYPVTVPTGGVVTIKMLFIKKSSKMQA